MGQLWGARTGFAHQYLLSTFPNIAVHKRVRRSVAVDAMAELRGVVTELHVHAAVKHIQGAFLQPVVAKLLAVPQDAAIDLVHLGKPAIDHQRGQNLATDTTGAVRNHGLVLQVVVLAGVQLGNKIVGGAHVRHHRAFESADLGLHGIAAVEEDHLVAALGNQFVDLGRGEVDAAADHAFRIDLQFPWRPERNDLIAHFHR